MERNQISHISSKLILQANTWTGKKYTNKSGLFAESGNLAFQTMKAESNWNKKKNQTVN